MEKLAPSSFRRGAIPPSGAAAKRRIAIILLIDLHLVIGSRDKEHKWTNSYVKGKPPEASCWGERFVRKLAQRSGSWLMFEPMLD